MRRNVPAAEHELAHLVDRADPFLPAIVALGWMRLEQRRWSDAESCFLRAARASELNVRVIEGLAICLLFQNRIDEAESWLGKALGHEYADLRLHALRDIARTRVGRARPPTSVPRFSGAIGKLYAELAAAPAPA